MLFRSYPHADSGLRSALNEQLVALLDLLLGSYVAQLTSLRRPGQQDRYDALEMEYTQRRSELLTPLRELRCCLGLIGFLSVFIHNHILVCFLLQYYY